MRPKAPLATTTIILKLLLSYSLSCSKAAPELLLSYFRAAPELFPSHSQANPEVTPKATPEAITEATPDQSNAQQLSNAHQVLLMFSNELQRDSKKIVKLAISIHSTKS